MSPREGISDSKWRSLTERSSMCLWLPEPAGPLACTYQNGIHRTWSWGRPGFQCKLLLFAPSGAFREPHTVLTMSLMDLVLFRFLFYIRHTVFSKMLYHTMFLVLTYCSRGKSCIRTWLMWTFASFLWGPENHGEREDNVFIEIITVSFIPCEHSMY